MCVCLCKCLSTHVHKHTLPQYLYMLLCNKAKCFIQRRHPKLQSPWFHCYIFYPDRKSDHPSRCCRVPFKFQWRKKGWMKGKTSKKKKKATAPFMQVLWLLAPSFRVCVFFLAATYHPPSSYPLGCANPGKHTPAPAWTNTHTKPPPAWPAVGPGWAGRAASNGRSGPRLIRWHAPSAPPPSPLLLLPPVIAHLHAVVYPRAHLTQGAARRKHLLPSLHLPPQHPDSVYARRPERALTTLCSLSLLTLASLLFPKPPALAVASCCLTVHLGARVLLCFVVIQKMLYKARLFPGRTFWIYCCGIETHFNYCCCNYCYKYYLN